MISSALRIRVTIEEPIKSRAASGAEEISYQEVVRRFARVITKGGGEGERAGLEVRAVRPYTLDLRYETALANISEDWRVLSGNLTLRVKSVENVGLANRTLRLLCESDG